MDANQDLFCHTETHLFLRINGVYYHRNDGRGWEIVSQWQLPSDVHWAPLNKQQQAVFLPILEDEGLLKG